MADLDWLKAANQDWKRRTEIATARAQSAEKFLARETAERKRLAASRRFWRRFTISAYSYFGGYVGIASLHWTPWVYFGSGVVACLVWSSVEALEARRARRKAPEL